MYDVGKKLMKAEKKEHEAQEYELKKQKLMGQAPKVEKQDKTTSGKEDPEKTSGKKDLEKAKSGDSDNKFPC